MVFLSVGLFSSSFSISSFLLSCRRRLEPETLGTPRQVPEKLGKSESPIQGLRANTLGTRLKVCLFQSARRRKERVCNMWALLPLSALLLFSSFAVTVCEDKKEANDGSIVRARLEVSVQYYILCACFESLLGRRKLTCKVLICRSKLC